MWYAFLADTVVAIHLAYVSYVLFGQLAILVGVLMRWRWARNPWFRWTHLTAILIVAIETIFNWQCPLTRWEHQLRHLAGQEAAEGTFIGQLLHDLMFFNGPQWVFNACYLCFAVIVLGTFVLAPPRRRRSEGEKSAQTGPPRHEVNGASGEHAGASVRA
jgi:hypothetical protein